MDLSPEVLEIIKNAKTIAVVGCSTNPEKAAHEVPKYLQSQGYKIIPVNPRADKILGEPAKKSLKEINEPVDIVDVFRPSDETPAIVAEAVKLSPPPKLIWLQLGIKNDEAKKIAKESGIPIVMDHCLMVEHKRYFGKK